MRQDIQTLILISIPIILQLLGVAFVVSIDQYFGVKRKKIMNMIVILILVLFVRDVVAHELDILGTMPFERTVWAIVGYIIRPFLIVLYLYLATPDRKYVVPLMLAAVNAVLYLTALFSGIVFSIDGNNVFHRGPLGFTEHVIGFALLVYTVSSAIKDYGQNRQIENVIPIVVLILIIISLILDSVVDYRRLPVTYITIFAASLNIFYYVWLHLQFVREHEEDIKAQQRIKIMMSQIQPHFLYNTLGTIKALCEKDPELAAQITGNFAKYLRQNLESIEFNGKMDFEKEMEHTRIYADIEMVRFPNIRLETDIQDSGFAIPALTIQPMVENAIRHGIRIRDEGIVKVSSRRVSGFHEITISDNGTGFDMTEIDNATGLHIGIKNVKDRIEQMCGGTLDIDSVQGQGTTVVIKIPTENFFGGET